MRSRELALLLAKDARELRSSRSFWLLLGLIGPLVGQAFVSAVGLYGEVSGSGGVQALPQGLNPLDGILVPTWGAYDLAATLLFPFVAIRAVAGEKESGAWKLLLQSPARLSTMLLSKGAVLVAGWLLAFVPGLLALALWTSYGGHVSAPETLNLVAGHLLRMLVATGVAFAAAAVAGSAASAAIAALAFTVGTWALDLFAAGRGGLLRRIASLTPVALLRVFEQGELRASTVAASLVLCAGGVSLAAVWLAPGRMDRERLSRGSLLLLATLGALLLSVRLPGGLDASENRRHSFSRADARALSRLPGPIRVQVHLAAEDPRLMDLGRGVLGKLERLRNDVDVAYDASSRTGLFESSDQRYGEIWWEVGGRRAMSRSVTEPVVLELLYRLGGATPPAPSSESEFPGYPLAASPRGAALLFTVVWPAAVAASWLLVRRRAALDASRPRKDEIMKRLTVTSAAGLLAVSLAASAPALLAAPPAPSPAAPQPGPSDTRRFDLSAEKAGQESSVFLSAVGNWIVAEDAGRKVLVVDGREWKRGQPSTGLAEKARAIYGAKHEDFLDGVKAFAYFPITIAKGVDDFREGEISVRFKLVDGQMDQCAGILFDVKPNGDYLTVRYNRKDVNVVLWTFNEGKRKFVKKGPDEITLPMKEWHDLKIAVKGTSLTAFLDGKLFLEHTLAKPVSGKVGLWSKTDSVSAFDGFTVTPAAR